MIKNFKQFETSIYNQGMYYMYDPEKSRIQFDKMDKYQQAKEIKNYIIRFTRDINNIIIEPVDDYFTINCTDDKYQETRKKMLDDGLHSSSIKTFDRKIDEVIDNVARFYNVNLVRIN